MASDEEFLESLKVGVSVKGTTPSAVMKTKYHAVGPDPEGEVSVGGKLVFRNRMGRSCFFLLLDLSGTTLVLLTAKILGDEQFHALKNMDLGFILEAKGPVFRNRVGELTVLATEVYLVAWSDLMEKEEDKEQKLEKVDSEE